MADWVDLAIEAMESGRAALLATVVGADGALSELLGRKLLISEDGILAGTVGAETLDVRVAEDARERLRRGMGPGVVSVSLTGSEIRQMGLSHGGDVGILLDPLLPPPVLLIVGAGHIARPLSQMGRLLGFLVAVVDDRSSFANRKRFPEADRILCGPYRQELSGFPITPSTYVIVVTRGHIQDEEVLAALVDSRAGYIGMIGSRRRVAGVFARLQGAGVPGEWLGRIHAPIGLDIGAETPEEIAVSILAEVINARHRCEPHPSSLSALERRRE